MDKRRHGHQQRTSLLDYKGRNRNKPKRNKPVCERFSRAVYVGDGEWRYMPMNCKSKLCPRCAPRMAARRALEIAEAVRHHRLKSFVTLTLAGDSLSQQELLRRLRSIWTKLRTYFVRRFRETMTYIAVVEVSSNGNPHLHVLVRQKLDLEWITNTWTTLGGGEFVTVEPIETELAPLCRYLVKQMSRPPEHPLPPGTRLLSKSRDIRFADYRLTNPIRAVFRPVGDLRQDAGEHFLRDQGQGFVADTGDLR